MDNRLEISLGLSGVMAVNPCPLEALLLNPKSFFPLRLSGHPVQDWSQAEGEQGMTAME